MKTPRIQWTAHAAAYTILGPVLLAVGARLGSVPLVALAGVLLLLVTWDAVRLQVGPPDVVAEVHGRRVPEGGKVVVRLSGRRLRNQHQIHVPLAPGLRLSAGSNLWHPEGEHEATHEFTLEAAVRGPQAIGPVTVRMWSAARLWSRDLILVPKDIVDVVPRAEDVSEFGILSKVVKPMSGRFTVNRPGQGFDFFTLRHYHPGDTMRAVNWKASARKDDDLIVNQRQMETHSELLILLDARAVSGVGPIGQTPLDRGCRVALGLFVEAVSQRDTVRFLAYGDGIVTLPPGRSDRVTALETVLAHLGAKGNVPLMEAWGVARKDMKSPGPVVVISSTEADGSSAAAMADMAGRGHPVTLLSPRPIGTDWESDRVRHESRDHQMQAVRDRGAMVVDWIVSTPVHAEKPVLRGRFG